jgi:hypothetical protein
MMDEVTSRSRDISDDSGNAGLMEKFPKVLLHRIGGKTVADGQDPEGVRRCRGGRIRNRIVRNNRVILDRNVRPRTTAEDGQ